MRDKLERRRAFLAGLGALAAGGPKVWMPAVKARELRSGDTSTLPGQVVSRGDTDYEVHRRAAVWQAIKPARYPDLIVRARSEADVVETMRYASANGTPVGVRGSGHNYVASYLRDGGILLDVSRLRDIEVDEDSRVARVQPGLRAAELAAMLGRQQLAFPIAHAGTVGLGGYLLGGGMGWNGEYWGQFACFNVRAVELVTAAGERITASRDAHPDLYWAARGAGPAFCAVATRFHLDVFALPRAISASTRVYSIDALGAVTAWLEQAAPRHDPKVELTLILEKADPSNRAGSNPAYSCVVSAVCFADDPAEARALLDELGDGAPQEGCTECDPYRLTNFAELLAAARTAAPRRVAVDTAWVRQRREALLALGPVFKRVPSPHATLIANYRAVPQLPPDPAACSVVAPLFINCFLGWDGAESDAENLRWLDETMEMLGHFTVGSYINETDFFRRPERARLGFSADSWQRLKSVSDEYDPQGLLMRPFDL